MPTRRAKTIWNWLTREINPSAPDDVQREEKVSKYFGNDPMAVVAFLNTLNNAHGFRQDGLALLPGEVVPDPLVRELYIAILDDYLRRGWRV